MLGELYRPRGKALEHARVVLETEEVYFVGLMVFGKWNYDKRASTSEASEYYHGAVDVFRDFCTDHGIRHYVKSGTVKFIEDRGV